MQAQVAGAVGGIQGEGEGAEREPGESTTSATPTAVRACRSRVARWAEVTTVEYVALTCVRRWLLV